MRFFTPLFLTTILTLSSCASEEIQQDNNETLLKSYTLTKDSQGKYSIDYELKENTTSSITKDIETNTNQVQIFSGKVAMNNKQSQSLSSDNDLMMLDFYEYGDKTKSLYVEDGLYSEFLEMYSVTDLGDDNYQLDFKIKEGTSFWYEYNEETAAYEIHLKEGVSNGTEFSKTYTKTLDTLKIDFVNYVNYSAKGVTSTTVKKPKIATVN